MDGRKEKEEAKKFFEYQLLHFNNITNLCVTIIHCRWIDSV